MSLYVRWYDYVIFIAMLAFSTSIGIYFGCFGTKQATTKEYLMGGKTMKVIPIAISVAVSHLSGTTLLATVADVYRYGASVWLFVVSYIFMSLLAIFIYLPIFFKLQVTNIYEYLERRFDKKTRRLAFIIYFLSEILKFPVHAYTPSLTIATITGINVHLIATLLCLICIIYTSIGGLKTVVWTDFFQFGIILACLLSVCVIGLNASGGMSSIWSTAEEGGRLQIFNFAIDPTLRDGFWGYSIAATFIATGAMVVHQTGAQKFLSLPKLKDCKRSAILAALSKSLVHTFVVFCGLVAYFKYKDCDPLTSKKISKHDQLFPYFITAIGSKFPGLSGLFMATITSASLSSMSSDLNALSGVIYKDFLCFFIKPKSSEKQSSTILKIIVLVVGIFCTCLVFAVEKLGEIFSITMTIMGITQGPLLGVFTLGALFPTANPKGAFYGMVVGFISVSSIAIPAKYYQLNGLMKYPTKPLTTSGCDLNQTMRSIRNLTLNAISVTSTNITLEQVSLVPWIFKISFYYYSIIGVTMTIIVGLIVSFCCRSNSSIDKNLLSPVVHSCLSKKFQSGKRVPYASVGYALEFFGGKN